MPQNIITSTSTCQNNVFPTNENLKSLRSALDRINLVPQSKDWIIYLIKDNDHFRLAYDINGPKPSCDVYNNFK